MIDLLVVVPARGGSKRLPGKNLRFLGDRTLLAHTAAAVAEARIEAPVLLTTDDDAIADEGITLGWQVPFRRPAALASDASTMADTVLHAMDWFRDDRGKDADAVMVLQPTSPFRGGACLAAAFSLLEAHPGIDSVVGMTRLPLNADKLFTSGPEGAATALAAQPAPVFMPNGAVYLVRSAAIREQRSLYAKKTAVLEMDSARALDIDTEADWRLAEAFFATGVLDGSLS